MRAGLRLIFAALLFGAANGAQPTVVPDGFTIAVGGDMIGPLHPIDETLDPGFTQVASLFRRADLGFANQEGSILDLGSLAVYPAAETGGGFPQQPSQMAKGLRQMGLTIVSKANNHATDFGAEGLVATLRNLQDAGLAEAGAGMS